MSTLNNTVTLIGNVGGEVVVKTLDTGKKVCNMSLATKEIYINDSGSSVTNTQWHHVVAWGKKAELLENYVSKGDKIAIEGKLKNNVVKTEDTTHYNTFIEMRNVEFFSSQHKKK
jgi:single-strand DNA-binding protein